MLWVVCACADRFKGMACAMKHMHVSEECGWTCWIGSVLVVICVKCWCGGKAYSGRVVPPLRTLFSASDASGPWHVRVAWLTNLTLYFYCMTKIRSLRHFCTLWAELIFFFVLLPSFSKKLLFPTFLLSFTFPYYYTFFEISFTIVSAALLSL